MKPQAKELALAILTRIEEREGTANKTKLLKLMYLADIEHYRTTRETLTGFDWLFFLYGPWATEYDDLLEQLDTEGAITLEKWSKASVEGERVSTRTHVSLDKLGFSNDAFFRTQRQIDAWAESGIPKLLDYVYFQTEPMQDAEKMKPLDFTKVSTEPPMLYRRQRSGTSPGEIQRLRRRFLETKSQRAGEQFPYQSAPYDAAFLDAMSIFEREES
jgi:Protein of unknown function (DUF4065)